jgi:hypothetical protein
MAFFSEEETNILNPRYHRYTGKNRTHCLAERNKRYKQIPMNTVVVAGVVKFLF